MVVGSNEARWGVPLGKCETTITFPRLFIVVYGEFGWGGTTVTSEHRRPMVGSAGKETTR